MNLDYTRIRQQSIKLTDGLSVEDMMLQSMPDTSPIKWHLAHTTWFFDTFVLKPTDPDYKPFDSRFGYLFNSYYDSVGERHPRPSRGMLSRPSLDQVLAYRQHVDNHISALLESSEVQREIEFITGLHHEMQHQELMVTDIKHALSLNNFNRCQYKAFIPESAGLPQQFSRFDAELTEIGSPEHGFSYDCERPQHSVFVPAFELSNRLVSNADWLEFIADGGYRRPELWLADGWACCQENQWRAPLYWRQNSDGEWTVFTLDGEKISRSAPVCHVSFYEADAFARWAGYRLPTEFELECAAVKHPIAGNFAESAQFKPHPADQTQLLNQIYGDVWEWTQSAFAPFPGFETSAGALGEYNGKFMANQLVLRGGSCATPVAQMRPSYRNFFYPHQRWQFTGVRLARTLR